MKQQKEATTTRARVLQPCALISLLGLSLLALGACQHGPPNISIYPGDAQVDQTKFVGEGRLSHAPEFVELNIEITSHCYPTPIGAVKATDAAVTKVMDLLKARLDPDNPKDGVFAQGGYTQPYSRYDSHGKRQLCLGTFQKTSTVTLKTSRVETFSKEFAEIQNIVFTTMSPPSDRDVEQGVTFATSGVPEPQLYHETRERLEQEALADAIDNARMKFLATAGAACDDTSYRVLKFVENDPSAGRPIGYGAAPSGATGAGGAVGFDAIWVNKALDVYFLIDSECRKT